MGQWSRQKAKPLLLNGQRRKRDGKWVGLKKKRTPLLHWMPGREHLGRMGDHEEEPEGKKGKKGGCNWEERTLFLEEQVSPRLTLSSA